jgi:hypothetical protein
MNRFKPGTSKYKKALDSHPFYSKNKDLIEKYAFYSGTTGGEGRSFQGKTFNEATIWKRQYRW